MPFLSKTFLFQFLSNILIHCPLNNGSRAAPLGGHNWSRGHLKPKFQFCELIDVIEITNFQYCEMRNMEIQAQTSIGLIAFKGIARNNPMGSESKFLYLHREAKQGLLRGRSAL